MYLGYESIVADATIKTVADLTIPANALGAELQASVNPVSYTMDGSTDPTSVSGMAMATADQPRLFLIEDVRRIRFIRAAALNGRLNLHYWSGRDI